MYISVFGLGFTVFVNENRSQESFETEIQALQPNCTYPTKDNPFMNVNIFEQLDNPTRPEGCDITDPYVMEDIEEKFGTDLFKDVSDIFGKQQSQRQYHKMPSTTIPNDREAFNNFLHGDMRSCKENRYDCVPYERLQQKRPIFPYESGRM